MKKVTMKGQRWVMGMILLALATGVGRGESVQNGNQLALEFATGDAATRKSIKDERLNKIQTFRYLKVTRITRDQPKTGAYTLETIEPSSDMKVVLVVLTPVALRLAATLQTNDCLRTNGRMIKLEEKPAPWMELNPALLYSKDGSGPTKGTEFFGEALNTVDPTAH